jgi:signal transduction histidine kinase
VAARLSPGDAAQGEVPVSIDVHEAPSVVQQLQETCHDMREPVASVLALTAAAMAEPGVPAAVRIRLEQIAGQAEWLADMIHDFLRDSMREEQEETNEKDSDGAGKTGSHLDVVRVVTEVIAAARLNWLCDLTVTSPVAPVRCALHPALLRRIVSNVLSNAARAAGPSGLVTVKIWRSKGLLRLVVEDSGPGFGNIPSGLGLGLPWVARTTIRHGGRIECGRGAGGGARVSLWVP